MDIQTIPILEDNYAYLLTGERGSVAVIDPGEADPVIAAIEAQGGGRLDYILNTHHHWDHTDGNEALVKRYGAEIVAPASEAKRINNITHGLRDGDVFDFDGTQARIFETPGHTLGGICFYFAEAQAVFTGDTLFSMGSGRLFEGTPRQMYDSLQTLAALPDETFVYCGHEYTQSNGAFALRVEPDNQAIQKRMDKVKALRADGQPTIPSTIGLEKETNVFMRAENAVHFAEIRALKDKG